MKLPPKSVFFGYYQPFLPFLRECVFVWDANLGLEISAVECPGRSVDEGSLKTNNQILKKFTRSEERRQ